MTNAGEVVVFVDGMDVSGIKTVGELGNKRSGSAVKILEKLGINNATLSEALTKVLTEVNSDVTITNNVEVKAGTPSATAGAYGVIAAAGNANHVPAVATGWLRAVCAHNGEMEKDFIKEPTCAEPGLYHDVCRICGLRLPERKTAEALGHDLRIDTIDATCTADGSKTTTCSRCDYEEAEPIPATGHDYVLHRQQ